MTELTNTELEIMEVFWELNQGIPFKELLDYLNQKLGKGWKRQTLSTYLAHLQKLKLVKSNGQRKNYVYYPLCTKEEYLHRETKALIKKTYNNSLAQFFCAFTGGQKLSKQEADDLRKLLNQYSPDLEETNH